MSLRSRRIQYHATSLQREQLQPEPYLQWHHWYDDAVKANIVEPNAMTFATAANATPDARIVLVRSVDEAGLVFFTNYDSTKSRQLLANPRVAATFGWLDLHRQVRVRGVASKVSDQESDDYFASRPRDSQIGAWASPQSTEITDRSVLETAIVGVEKHFDGQNVTRPPHWGGWRIQPSEWEFWQGQPDRLHDRFLYRRQPAPANGWTITRLAP